MANAPDSADTERHGLDNPARRPHIEHRFSVLDLSNEVASKWFKQEHPFTARNMFNDSAVPEKCFAAAREDTAWAKMTMKYCRTNTASYYPGDIQHGRNAYMTFVAKRLEQAPGA